MLLGTLIHYTHELVDHLGKSVEVLVNAWLLVVASICPKSEVFLAGLGHLDKTQKL